MAEIKTAQEAVYTAENFLSRYHAFKVLKKVVREDDKWVTVFDVGILATELIRITIDASTGNVFGYEKAE